MSDNSMEDIAAQNKFSSLSAISLSSSSRLLSGAFCPTRDLFVLVAETEGTDRVAMWKSTGSKVWDVSLGAQDRLVDVAWSPDGNWLMLARDPPRLTLHSVHDGLELKSLTVPFDELPDPSGKGKGPMRERPIQLQKIWWLGQVDKEPLPGIGKQKDRRPTHGSAHSVLASIPYVTFPRAEPKSTSIFSLNKDKTAAMAPKLPPSLLGFPSLLSDPVTSSIHVVHPTTVPSARLKDDEARNSHEIDDSVLVVSDDSGTLHFFLKGTYPLGFVQLGKECSAVSVYLHHQERLMTVNYRNGSNLDVAMIQIPLLHGRALQATARASDAVQKLLILAYNTIDDMARQWMGADGSEGARDMGPKWVDILSKRGTSSKDPQFDLLSCLVTGRPRPGMVDFLGMLTERAWESWNTTVQNTFKHMERSCLERVIPACERVVVVLEEMKGWSHWTEQYSRFSVQTDEIEECVTLALRLIELTHALASHIIDERWAFDGLMVWLRYESAKIGSETPPAEHPGHDILQVAEYIQDGLLQSRTDGWFTGPLPLTSPSEKASADNSTSLDAMILNARAALNGPVAKTYRMHMPPVHVADHLDADKTPITTEDYPPSKTQGEQMVLGMDRNLLALLGELCERCRRIFSHAAGAVGRTAVLGAPWLLASNLDSTLEANQQQSYRDHILPIAEDEMIQYVGLKLAPTPGGTDTLCILCLKYSCAQAEKLQLTGASVILVECVLPQLGACQLLDWQFFDEINILLVLRPSEDTEPAPLLASVFYADLPFREIRFPIETDILSRVQAMQRAGELATLPLALARSQTLDNLRHGVVSLACNGAESRRTACVLGNEGLDAEVFDLYGNEMLEETVGTGPTDEGE